ncbi:MAG: T9SS type A sorting domain-containing protein [Candidatus Zixiibacteriota bacterium]
MSPGETAEVNIAWAADNDGDPRSAQLTSGSPASVVGIKLLGSSNPDARISYNWLVSHGEGYPRDWGPWLKFNQENWEKINPYGSGIYFPDTAMGTPGGDRSKYFLMSNGEIDFNQIFTDTLPKIDTNWVPADIRWSKDFADGIDIRFVYSFGAFDLAPGDTIFAAVALVAGEDFHIDPANRAKNLPDNPYLYYENLNFSDLVYNSQMALEAYQSFVKKKGTRQRMPADFSLKQNYPNPFNAGTTIPFTVYSKLEMENSPIHTTLAIYNILGQKVKTLVDETKLPGEYEVRWYGKDEKGNFVASGIYLYQLKAADFHESRKLILLR